MKRNIYGKEITPIKNNDSSLKNYYNFTNITKWTNAVYPQDKKQKPYTPPRKAHKSSLADTVHQSAIVDLTGNEQTSHNTTAQNNSDFQIIKNFFDRHNLQTRYNKPLCELPDKTEAVNKIIRLKKIKNFYGLKDAAIKLDSPEVLNIIIGGRFIKSRNISKDISTALEYNSLNILEYLVKNFPAQCHSLNTNKLDKVCSTLESARKEGKISYSYPQKASIETMEANNVTKHIPEFQIIEKFLKAKELYIPCVKNILEDPAQTDIEKINKITNQSLGHKSKGLKSAAIEFDSPEVLEVIIGKNFTQGATTFSKNISTALRYKSFNVLEYLITKFPDKAQSVRRSKMQEVSKALEQAKIEGKVHYSAGKASEKATNDLEQIRVADKIPDSSIAKNHETGTANNHHNAATQISDCNSSAQDINDFLDQLDQYDDLIKEFLSEHSPVSYANTQPQITAVSDPNEEGAFIDNLLMETLGTNNAFNSNLPRKATSSCPDQHSADYIFNEFSELLKNC